MEGFHVQLVSLDDARGMERCEIAMLRNEIAGAFAILLVLTFLHMLGPDFVDSLSIFCAVWGG